MTQANAATTKDLSVTRTFDAPVERVWKQWSESENVMRWWGPKGFTSPLAKIEFREGGVSLVYMRAPKEFGGFDMYNTWTYKKIVPHERIEFVLNFSDKDGNKLDPANIGLPQDPRRRSAHHHVQRFRRQQNRNDCQRVRIYDGPGSRDVEGRSGTVSR